MRIMLPGTVNNMSVVIAICSEAFCLMAADSRCMINNDNGEWTFKDDSTRKIFSVENKVLFGGAGQFWNTEKIYSPIDNIRVLTLDRVANLAEHYINDHALVIDRYRRTYVMCGRDNDGLNTIIGINYDAETKRARRMVYKPYIKGSIVSEMILPNALKDQADRYNDLLSKEVLAADSMVELKARLANLIRKIGKDDIEKTVGGKVQFLMI